MTLWAYSSLLPCKIYVPPQKRLSWQGLSGAAWYSLECGSEQGLPWELKLASEKPASPFFPGHAEDSDEIQWHYRQESRDSNGKEDSHQFTDTHMYRWAVPYVDTCTDAVGLGQLIMTS